MSITAEIALQRRDEQLDQVARVSEIMDQLKKELRTLQDMVPEFGELERFTLDFQSTLILKTKLYHFALRDTGITAMKNVGGQ